MLQRERLQVSRTAQFVRGGRFPFYRNFVSGERIAPGYNFRVMKNFLILVLSLALMSAAYFTRPTETDYRRISGVSALSQTAIISNDAPIASADPGQFRDRYFWVEVKKDGKTALVGAFDHWFNLAVVRQERN